MTMPNLPSFLFLFILVLNLGSLQAQVQAQSVPLNDFIQNLRKKGADSVTILDHVTEALFFERKEIAEKIEELQNELKGIKPKMKGGIVSFLRPRLGGRKKLTWNQVIEKNDLEKEIRLKEREKNSIESLRDILSAISAVKNKKEILLSLLKNDDVPFDSGLLLSVNMLPERKQEKIMEILKTLEQMPDKQQIDFKVIDLFSYEQDYQFDLLKKMLDRPKNGQEKQIPLIAKLKNREQMRILDLFQNSADFDLDAVAKVDNDLPFQAYELLKSVGHPLALKEIVGFENPRQYQALKTLIDNNLTINIPLIHSMENDYQREILDLLIEAKKPLANDTVEGINNSHQVDLAKFLVSKGIPLLPRVLPGINNRHQVNTVEYFSKNHLHIPLPVIHAMSGEHHMKLVKLLAVKAPHLMDSKTLSKFTAGDIDQQMNFLERLIREYPASLPGSLNIIPNIKNESQMDFYLLLLNKKREIDENVVKIVNKIENPFQAKAFTLLVDNSVPFDDFVDQVQHFDNKFQVATLENVIKKKQEFFFTSIVRVSNAHEAAVYFGKKSKEKQQLDELIEMQYMLKAFNGPGSLSGTVKKECPGDEKFANCTNGDCRNIVSIKESENYAVCDYCHTKTCTKCLKKVHKNLSCVDAAGEGPNDPPSSYLFTGIPNLGNTCFANSSFKLLSKLMSDIPEFKELLDPNVHKLARNEKVESSMGFKNRQLLQILLKDAIEAIIENKEDKVREYVDAFFEQFKVVLADRKETFGKKTHRLKVHQFDPEEFLHKIFSYIEFEKSALLPATADILYPKVGAISVKPTIRPIPQIPVKGFDGIKVKNIQAGIDIMFTKIENVEDYKNEGTKIKGARKGEVFLKAPKFLIVEENRYSYLDGTGKKLTDTMELTAKLKIKIFNKEFKQVGVAIMKPVASVVHSGNSLDGGHYYAYIKDGPSEKDSRPKSIKNSDKDTVSEKIGSTEDIFGLFALIGNELPKKPVKDAPEPAPAQAKTWVMHNDSAVSLPMNQEYVQEEVVEQSYLVAYELVEYREGEVSAEESPEETDLKIANSVSFEELAAVVSPKSKNGVSPKKQKTIKKYTPRKIKFERGFHGP